MEFQRPYKNRPWRRTVGATGLVLLAFSLGACTRSLVGVAPSNKDTRTAAKSTAADTRKTGAGGTTTDAAGNPTGGTGTASGSSEAQAKPLNDGGAIVPDNDGSGTGGSTTAGTATGAGAGTGKDGGTGADGTRAGAAGQGGTAAGAAGAGGATGAKGSTAAGANSAGAGGKPGAAGAGGAKAGTADASDGSKKSAGGAGAAGGKSTAGGAAGDASANAKGAGGKTTGGGAAGDSAANAKGAGGKAGTDGGVSDAEAQAAAEEAARQAAIEAERRGRVETAANRVVIDQDEKLQTLGGTLPATFNMDEKGQFEFDRYELSTEVKAKLDEIGEKLKDAPYDRLIVHGYTDRIGTDDYNQELSEKRAWAVAGYLMDKGVPPYKLTVVGRGKTAPLTTPDECKGLRRDALIDCLQRDRRVEVVATLKEYNLKVQ